MDGDLDCTLLTAAKLSLEVARFLEGASVLAGEGPERGYWSAKAAMFRREADSISPPADGWPKGDCQIFDLLTRARLA